MSEIAPADALDLVCRGLAEQVITNLTDPHAVSTVTSVITILRSLQAELRDDGRWRDAVVADALALADRAIAAAGEDARASFDAARAGGPEAHRHAMLAVQKTLDAMWRAPERDRELLRALRRVARSDVK